MFNIRVIKVPGEEEKEYCMGPIFEKNKDKDFPKVTINIKSH